MIQNTNNLEHLHSFPRDNAIKELRNLNRALNIARVIRKKLKHSIDKIATTPNTIYKEKLVKFFGKNEISIHKAKQMIQNEFKSIRVERAITIYDPWRKLRKNQMPYNVDTLYLSRVDITATSKVPPLVFGGAFLNFNIFNLHISQSNVQLMGLTKHMNRLQQLNIDRSQVGENAGQAIARYLYKLNNLRIKQTNINDKQMAFITAGCSRLISLILIQNKHMSKQTLRMIGHSQMKLRTLSYNSNQKVDSYIWVGLTAMGVEHNMLLDSRMFQFLENRKRTVYYNLQRHLAARKK